MIQDRTMQDLWAAVEELRQKVEQLENGGPPPATSMSVPQFDYVASIKSNRKTFHLRDCRFTGGFMTVEENYQVFESRDAAMESGLKPCKSCGA
jgi:hypothetical protein